MDVKALAKSKRAHSLHHNKKNHRHHSAKAPPVASADKKQTGKQAKDEPSPVHESRPLPSNQERYDDAFGSVSDEALPSNAHPPEIVAPKSKGADYAYLISEAEAQAQSRRTSSFIPLPDDVTYDFGPMLLERGQSILSWVEDDDFESDGKASSNFQIPFLSLDLDALAVQLARTKPSDRLFIDHDVLSKEVLDNELGDQHDADFFRTAIEQDYSPPSISSNEKKDRDESSLFLLSSNGNAGILGRSGRSGRGRRHVFPGRCTWHCFWRTETIARSP